MSRTRRPGLPSTHPHTTLEGADGTGSYGRGGARAGGLGPEDECSHRDRRRSRSEGGSGQTRRPRAHTGTEDGTGATEGLDVRDRPETPATSPHDRRGSYQEYRGLPSSAEART